MTRSQETRLPSGPEPSGRNESPCSPDCVNSGTAALAADNPERRSDDDAAGKQSAPEMGNRKSSARDSGSARRGDISVEARASFSLTQNQMTLALDTRFALIALMRAIRAQCRPSKLPIPVRAAWDDCERVLGPELSLDIETEAHGRPGLAVRT